MLHCSLVFHLSIHFHSSKTVFVYSFLKLFFIFCVSVSYFKKLFFIFFFFSILPTLVFSFFRSDLDLQKNCFSFFDFDGLLKNQFFKHGLDGGPTFSGPLLRWTAGPLSAGPPQISLFFHALPPDFCSLFPTALHERFAKLAGAKGDHTRHVQRDDPLQTSRQGHLRSRRQVQILTQRSRFEARRQGKCGKITDPPHWAKSCPEAASAMASSSSGMAPPSLLAPVYNSANSENVVALAAISRGVFFPGGSSESARATRLATLARSAGYVVCQNFLVFAARDQTKHLSMVVDSCAELHLVCPDHKHFMMNVTKLTVPLQLETAGGDLTLDTIGDLLCGGIVCHGCVFNPLLTASLFSTVRGEKD